jgi:hypothetical protein
VSRASIQRYTLLPFDIATLEIVLDMIYSSTVYSSGVLSVRIRSVENIDGPEFVWALVVVAFKVPAFGDGKLFSVSVDTITNRV